VQNCAAGSKPVALISNDDFESGRDGIHFANRAAFVK
jgi:hypothetical protein